MPLRDLLLAATVFGSLPFCLAFPWVGILMWSWIGYMNPHRLAFGFAYGFPWAYLVAVVTLVGFVFTRDRRRFPRAREVWFLLAFWGWVSLTTLSANYPEDAWIQWDKVSKIFFMIVVSLFVMQEPMRVKLLLWIMGLSIGFYGLKGGIHGLQHGGATSMVLGPEGSFIGGNTEIGLAFTMALPILVFLRREAPRWWVRHLLTATIAFTTVATVFTFSRGAALTLAIIIPILALKSRRRILALLVLAVGGSVLLSVAPDDWFARVETIRTYELDESAMGRIHAWQVAIALAGDHPFVGGGFRTFGLEIFDRYGFPGGRDAHSIYFQVLGEHGYVGLGLYLGIIISTLLSLRRLARKPQPEPSRQWMTHCARMLQVSLIAYLIGGAFLSMSYFDYFYGLVQVTVLLKVLDARPVDSPGVSTTLAPRPAAHRGLVRAGSRG